MSRDGAQSPTGVPCAAADRRAGPPLPVDPAGRWRVAASVRAASAAARGGPTGVSGGVGTRGDARGGRRPARPPTPRRLQRRRTTARHRRDGVTGACQGGRTAGASADGATPVGAAGAGQAGGGQHPGHADHDRRREQVDQLGGQVGRTAGQRQSSTDQYVAPESRSPPDGGRSDRTCGAWPSGCLHELRVRPCGPLRWTPGETSPAPDAGDADRERTHVDADAPARTPTRPTGRLVAVSRRSGRRRGCA